MNLRNIFTTALGCFAVLAACGNDNDSDVTPTPDQPTEEAKGGCYYLCDEHQPYLRLEKVWTGLRHRKQHVTFYRDT